MIVTEVLFCIGLLVTVSQVWVSMRLLRAPQYEPRQKWLQFVLIWLIPVLGAVVVYSMLRSEGLSPYKPEKGYTEPGDNAS